MLICVKCGGKSEEGAATCSSCSEPLDVAGARSIAGDPRKLIGRIVNGKYEVLEILGEGGMGVVYKVHHLILQNKNIFALKILRPRFSCQSNFQARFLREVEIAMELTHENIIQIRDFGVTEQNLLFYTMDFFPGESLKRMIQREGPLPGERVRGIGRQILLALAEAHKIGVVHRDLKPDNILIENTSEGVDRVRILDFGIAKVLVNEAESEEKNLTKGAVIGTPKYMSPEQAGGEKIDGRSDLYSLGIILYEMLMGRVPFAGGTARSILLSHLTVAPSPFREVRPDLKMPPDLEELVFHLLEKEREARPGSAEEVLAALTRSAGGVRRTSSRGRLSRARFLLGTGAVLGACLAAGVVLPWGAILNSVAEAGGRVPRAQGEAPTRPAPSETSAGVAEGPGAASPARPPPEKRAPRKLRCNLCGTSYAPGEKVGDMCHGEPLEEAP